MIKPEDYYKKYITEAIAIWECMNSEDDPVDTVEKVIGKLKEAMTN